MATTRHSTPPSPPPTSQKTPPVEFTLTVSDGTASVSDKVTVTITDSANTAPTVNAGPDQEAAEGATVNLDGTASDVDTEDTLEYSWSHNSTLTITLGDDEALDTSFTAPNVAEDTASRVHPDRVRRHRPQSPTRSQSP